MNQQTEIPWLNEILDIYYKLRNLNHDNPDMEIVNELYNRLKEIEPRINEFIPEAEDWGAINAKNSVVMDIRFMKAYFKSCGIEVV